MKSFLKTTAGAIGLAVLMAGPASAASIESPPGAAPGAAPGAPPGAAVAAVRSDMDGDRIEDTLGARIAASPAGERFDVIVMFEGPDAVGRGRAAAGPFAVTREFSIINGFQAQLTEPQIRGLSRAPGLVRISGNAEVEMHDIPSNDDMGATDARAEFRDGDGNLVDGSGVTICVIDTGIDAAHELFDTKGLGPGSFHDAVNNQPDPYDDNGHGSHTAGIATGDGGTSSLAAEAIGVAPGASLKVAKVLNANGGGTNAQVIEGIGWCAADVQGADILTMSLGGGPTDGTDPLSVAVNCVADPSPGICGVSNTAKIIVVSAGNAGAMWSTIGTPGVAEFAITVGSAAEWSGDPATNWQDDGLYLNTFSSRGPVVDGNGDWVRDKPDIVGPGSRVLSAYVFNQTPNNSYGVASGTSMSTPYVAGVIALMLNANSALGNDLDGVLPHVKVRAILASTAEDRGAPGIDNEYGHGVIDAYSAVAEAEFSGATAAQLFVPNAYPGYTRLLDQHVNDSDIWTKEFTVTTDLVYLPIAGTAIIDGTFVVDCLVWFPNFDPNEPDICLFWAELWSPDLELTIEEWTGSSWSEVLPGSGEVTLSECPAYGECGGVGRAEVVHFIPQREGTYRFRVFPFDDGVNAKGGDFDFEISMGVPAPGAGGNATPVVTISSPTDGTTFDDGVMISFAGTADDFEDGDLSASLSWFSDGVDIGTGATLPDMTLAVGSHTITASVTDFGDLLGQDSITVIVNGPLGTNPPAVTIVSPLNGATYAKGGLTFVGSATDVEDDEAGLTDLISWELDEVGIGIGASLLVPDLSLGSHTITALVTDSDGMTDEDTVTFDVIVVAHIADLVDESEPRPRNRWQAAVSVRVEHVDGSLVDGATVTGTWSNGVSGPGSCLTNASGQCKITWPNELKGNAAPVTFTINPFSGISGEDISYQSSANVESSINLDPNGPPPNQPPVAAISAPASGSTFGVFELIYFTESSSDPDGSIMSWHWDYGDYTSTNSQNPIAYYTDDGNYTVTLTVTDDDGATGSASTVIQVGTPPN